MYIKEDGKTFWDHGNGEFTRAHDENFQGMRFRHRRCPFCNRITSLHVLHWSNHIISCSKEYIDNNLEGQYLGDFLYDLMHHSLKESLSRNYLTVKKKKSSGKARKLKNGKKS